MLVRLAAALALAALPAFAQTVTIPTARGDVDVAPVPEKIAVYDMAALDTLDALGVVPAGTISNVYVDYLTDAAAGAEVVGSLFEPDLEALFALDPDLVIVGGRSSGHVGSLSRISDVIDMTIWTDPVAEGLQRLETYGRLFNREARAAELEAAFNAKLDQARQAVDGQGKALIVLTNGPRISAYGAKGRFGWLHNALNLPEAVEDVDQATHGEAISFEFIHDANPDILIVIDRLAAIGQPGANARSTLDNTLVQQTRAWADGKVIYLNAADIYVAGGGVQSMNRTLDLLLDVLARG